MENLITTVVEGTGIISFTFDLVYDLSRRAGSYEPLYNGTNPGAPFQPSIVPNSAGFTDFLQRVARGRGDGRGGCSIEVEITGDLYWDGGYPLLKAKYDAPIDDTSLNPNVGIQHMLGDSSNSNVRTLDDTRISFHVDADAHAKLRSKLLRSGSDDEQ
jgi:hypothetical protein